MAASFPTTYLKSGLSDATVCRITFATSDGCIVFCTTCFNAEIGTYIWSAGDLGGYGYIVGSAVSGNTIVVGTSEGYLNIYSI